MKEIEVFNELNDRMININIIDLYYNEKTEEFTNPYYTKLSNLVLEDAITRFSNADKVLELQRNLKLGVIVCDWWLDESECIRKIKKAATKREKNIILLCCF